MLRISRPKSFMTQYNYEDEYAAAVERTGSLGLRAPMLHKNHERQFSNRHCARLAGVVEGLVGGLEVRDLAGQCFAAHLAAAPLIEKEFGVSAVPTLGWIKASSEELFRTSELDLARYLVEGVPSRKLNLHCWLTLSSFEIIDITISTTFAVVHGTDDGLGNILAKHWSDLSGGLEYRPLLVGEQYLERTGMVLNIPFHEFEARL